MEAGLVLACPSALRPVPFDTVEPNQSVEQLAIFELVIDFKTTKAVGLMVRPSRFLRVHQLIE